MPALRLSFLGEVRLVGPDGSAFRLPTRKALFLLAPLAAAPDRKLSRDRVVNLLWSTRQEAQGRASLRQTLFLLHQRLAAGTGAALVADRETLSLDPDLVWVDLWALRDALTAATADALDHAASLYRGEFLEGLIPPDPALDDWLTSARADLRDMAVNLLERLVEVHAVPNPSEAVRAAERLVEIDPLREASHRLLIGALAAAGDRAEAMRRYLTVKDLLERELGVGLSAETEALHATLILNGGSVPPRHSAPAPEVAVRGSADVPPPPQAPLVVVLPFENLSPDSEEVYFSDGLTEDLIVALTSWRLFPVIAWSSSAAYRGMGVDDRRIGRELGARFVLRGTVRKSDRMVRITARCIDTATGLQIWAERYDRELADMFEVQDEIASKIAALVVPEMELTELKRSAARRTSDMTAWDYLLRGKALIANYTCKDNAEARSHFKSAIALDPDYSDAWTGLALSHLRDVDLECADQREAALAEAFATARHAVSLDAKSSAAHLCLGQAYIWAEDYEPAIAETTEAVRLNPCNARAGRLVAPDAGLGEDVDKQEVALDVGIDGAGASAEEAAMHITREPEPPEADEL
jgi:TolB-like protein/DNA-binding SARP family transcriptional activator